jgi:hypothetical protein
MFLGGLRELKVNNFEAPIIYVGVALCGYWISDDFFATFEN